MLEDPEVEKSWNGVTAREKISVGCASAMVCVWRYCFDCQQVSVLQLWNTAILSTPTIVTRGYGFAGYRLRRISMYDVVVLMVGQSQKVDTYLALGRAVTCETTKSGILKMAAMADTYWKS